MPDEATPAPEETQDTPQATEETAEATPSQEPTPPAEPPEGYVPQDRYENLQAEFTRRNQALAGQLGPEAQLEAIRHYGLDLVEDEDTDDDDDLPPDPDERLERLEQRLAEKEEAEELAEFERLEKDWLKEQRKEVEKTEDRELADLEWKVIQTHALANRDPDSGQPDIEGGKELLDSLYSDAQERLLGPKKRASKPSKGTAGVEKIDTSTDEGTRQALVAAIKESQAASE